MQAFSNAHNFIISNAIFSDQSIYQAGHSGIDDLRQSSAPQAAFDSDSRRYAPSCFPGTRSQYIEDIVYWGTAQSALPIYRMTGPAGVGKSAIAQTCAEELRSQHQLGASFFFTTHGCSDYSRFFPSLSYQLCSKFPDYHILLNKKLQLDPTLVRKRLKFQFKELIIEPLWELEQTGRPIGKRVILVDGLDECNDKDAQREIIEIVIDSVVAQTTPFQWAFFSRPEPRIEAAFADPRAASLCVSTFLPISRGIDREIELYLRSGLQDILRHRAITTSDPWPSERDLHFLVAAAQGLYIYAATILRFVGRTDTRYDPEELLHIVVERSKQRFDNDSSKTPFQELDIFYTLILQRVPNMLHPSIQLLLSLIVFQRMDGKIYRTIGIRSAGNALGFTEAKTKLLCGELVAVVRCHERYNLSTVKEDPSPFEEFYAREEWLTFYHKSFFDFLCDSTRSGVFCVTTSTMRNTLFQHLLTLQLDYSKFYSLQNSDLNLLTQDTDPRFADTRCGLSWPFDTERLNAVIKDFVYEIIGTVLRDSFFPYDDLDDELLRRFSYVHHRKYLMIQSEGLEVDGYQLGSNLFFPCGLKAVQGTILSSTARHGMLSFSADRFRKGILKLERAQVIQQYHPSSTSLELPLFRYDANGHALSGLYVIGRGQMSTFWYWFLDPEMRYFRDFETVDLVEGERIFKEENFDLWFYEGDDSEEEDDPVEED